MSRIGRSAVFNRSWRAVWTPIATPIRSVRSVATRTFASVIIAWFQRPSRRIRARQPAAPIAAGRPDTYHARTAAKAITSHHGALVRIVSSGFRTTAVIAFLKANVIGESVSVIQPAMAFTGSSSETWIASGNCVASTNAGARRPAPRIASGAPQPAARGAPRGGARAAPGERPGARRAAAGGSGDGATRRPHTSAGP